MTPDALLVLPGWIALLAFVTLVLATWTALAFYVIDLAISFVAGLRTH